MITRKKFLTACFASHGFEEADSLFNAEECTENTKGNRNDYKNIAHQIALNTAYSGRNWSLTLEVSSPAAKTERQERQAIIAETKATEIAFLRLPNIF